MTLKQHVTHRVLNRSTHKIREVRECTPESRGLLLYDVIRNKKTATYFLYNYIRNLLHFSILSAHLYMKMLESLTDLTINNHFFLHADSVRGAYGSASDSRSEAGCVFESRRGYILLRTFIYCFLFRFVKVIQRRNNPQYP